MFDDIKNELKTRKKEKTKLYQKVYKEKKRLANEREKIPKSFVRRIKFIDKRMTEKEEEADAQKLIEYEIREEKKMKLARAKRRSQILRTHRKGFVGIALIFVLFVGVIIGISGHIHEEKLEDYYNTGIEYILNGNYSKASSILQKTHEEDTGTLVSYASCQGNIEKYRGNPEKMLNDLIVLDGKINNIKVVEQYQYACEQLDSAIIVQEEIYSIDTNNLTLNDIPVLNSIYEEVDNLDDRYAAVVETENYHQAYLKIKDLEEAETKQASLSGSGATVPQNTNNSTVAGNSSVPETGINNTVPDTGVASGQGTTDDTIKLDQQPVQRDTSAPVQNRQAVENVSGNDRIVYVTETGDKYHNEGCQYVRGRNTWAMTQQDALSNGYTPCSKCQ